MMTAEESSNIKPIEENNPQMAIEEINHSPPKDSGWAWMLVIGKSPHIGMYILS